MATIRTLAFATPDGSVWGTAWVPGEERSSLVAYRIGNSAMVAEAELHASAETEAWRLEGGGVSLAFTPAGPRGRGSSTDSDVRSVDQLCSVAGRLALEADERELRCAGWRSTLEGELDLGAVDSFRQAAAWFESRHGLSLLALRPRTARGQDADLVTASLLEPELVARVADPRLSTTYDASGVPARAGLELWLESERAGEDAASDQHDGSRSDGDSRSDDDPDEDPDRHFIRRAAGEAVGERIDWELAGFKLHAALLRWHSRGDDGNGVYLLGQRG